MPLVGLEADEAVEVLKAGRRRPHVERPDHRRVAEMWDLVALPARRVAVELERLGQRRLVVGPQRRARRRGRELGDGPRPHRVVVATGQQRLSGRRAQRIGVKAVVAKPPLASRSATGVSHGPQTRSTPRTPHRQARSQNVRGTLRKAQLADRGKLGIRVLRVVGGQTRGDVGDRQIARWGWSWWSVVSVLGWLTWVLLLHVAARLPRTSTYWALGRIEVRQQREAHPDGLLLASGLFPRSLILIPFARDVKRESPAPCVPPNTTRSIHLGRGGRIARVDYFFC